ncbi:MAG: phosphate/phosphite/phosphonate ABC transporter substrate-binding protein [Gammaproteobacteria bacterium]|nr:phosphate/phosphite/phosphonate ABC transporter substrate-binding protein [Gammaproteobacteria bacterium]
MKKSLLAFLALTAFSMVASNVYAASINFGVQAPRSTLKAKAKWSKLGKYLSKETGKKVKIVPLKPGATVKAVASGKVNFMLSNPVLALMLTKKQGSSVIATVKRKSGSSQFAGVIISKKGSGITKAADTKGKKGMAFKFKKSAAAYVFQVKHLKDKGIDPHKDFASFKQAKKQDDIVLAVKAGIIDVGFIKSGLLETMEKEGKISVSDFEVVDKASDSLKQVHTTVLYPEWTATASSKADAATVKAVSEALLKLSASSDASKKAGINGFVAPLELTTLENTLKSLNLL